MGLFHKTQAPAPGGAKHDCGCGESFGSADELMAHAQKFHPK